MPPHQQFVDFQEVQFQGQVVHATYGPAGAPPHDVTAAVQGLQAQGRNHIVGGIHTAIGDPFPGVPKHFAVWYAQSPHQQFVDFQEVQFQGQVVAASYGPEGAPLHFVTPAVQGLQAQGRNHIVGGIHTAIGDPFPGVPKHFKVWYA